MRYDIAIIGGGPAGMQAALLLDQRKYRTILIDEREKLGGTLNVADKAPIKEKVAAMNNGMIREIEESGVDVRMNTKATVEMVKELNPDWMFVVDRDAAVGQAEAGDTAEQVLDNELVRATNAWQQDQVVYLSPERWYIVMTGASNFPAMLTEIADAIQ